MPLQILDSIMLKQTRLLTMTESDNPQKQTLAVNRNDMTELEPGVNSEKKFRSLNTTLMFWFLLLSLLPLTLVSWISYGQAKSSLHIAAEEKLEQASALNVHFIQNWFNYRFFDLNNHAEDEQSRELLALLIAGLQQSAKTPGDYVKSLDWLQRVDEKQNDFITLSRRYDYIYDLFLIDVQGNILFTVTHEADLGTNLFHGPYAQTHFGRTVKKTLETGQSFFSDLERYEPSNNIIAGFLTAPVLDELGGKLGVFAIQIRFDRILQNMNLANSGNSLIHYLVGEDGFLRSSMESKQEGQTDDMLRRRINTEQFKLWYSEHSQGQRLDGMSEKAFVYTGPGGKQVIGIHKSMKLSGVKWILISEVDQIEALADAAWLRRVTISLVIMTALMVVLLSVFLSRRITLPIIKLSHLAEMVAAGQVDKKVDILANNEIGQLANAFNHMLLMRQHHEQALQDSTRQAQQALTELEAQKFALDQHAIVAITDVKGTIIYANQLFADISGYTVDELLGQNHRLLNSGFHDRNFWKEMFHSVANGHVWHDEVCNKTKDGHLYWVDTTIVPFKDNHGKPKSYIAIRADITERKQAEMELIQARDAAEAAVRAKSEFLASMSHEIRTPMNGVLGMLGLVQNSELTEEQRHRVSLAQSSANALLTLINDILDFSKVEAGKLELEILDFNLRSMLGEFTEAMALQAHDKGLEVILDMTAAEHSMIRSDPGRIRQILTNLVGNAIKFTEQGEIIITVALIPEPSSREHQQYRLSVSVKDSGIGIPADKIALLFDSFSQVDASTTRKYGGTGLGLAIVKKLSELMGGDIQVTSVEGQGSCFEFYILVELSEQSVLVVPEVDVESLQLLIVDDNATNLEVIRGQLEHWGATVTEATNGADALALCDSRFRQENVPFFDIAFLDMQMPDMNGAQLGKALRADDRFNDMKLVMMTSMSSRGDAQYFSDLGFSAYFPKPATTSDLFDALLVVAEGGTALQQAQPLVTHHYLQTLAHNQSHLKIKAKQDQQPSSDSWPQQIRLLLVEDNQINQLVAKGILKNIGLQADIAANGHEALSSLQQSPENRPYTLILMDCQMPEMDGYEATRQIRAGKAGVRYLAIPIIAMTANAMQGDREKCLDAGMSDYMSKPINTERVYDKLTEWLINGGRTGGDDNRKSHDASDSNTNEDKGIGAADMISDSLADWDKSSALKRVGNKSEQLLPLIALFLDDIPTQMTELQLAIDKENSEHLSRTIHTIKGVAANLGGLRLQQLAAQMEADLKAGQFQSAKEKLPLLRDANAQLCLQLTQFQTKHPVSSTTETMINCEQLSVYLQSLRKKLQQGEYIDSQELALLQTDSADAKIQQLLQQLKGQTAQFDLPGALQTVNELAVLLNPDANIDVNIHENN